LKKLMVLAAAAGAAITVFSTGVASAQGSPSVSGKKYSEASQTLENAGYTVKVSNRVGGQLAQDDCLVTDQRDSSTPFAVGGDKTVLLSLNCTAVLSAASPEGRAAKKQQATVEWEKTPGGQQWCEESRVKHPDWGWDSSPGLAGCQSGG
jgi:beta-lactam-binding protein with PASTA domain